MTGRFLLQLFMDGWVEGKTGERTGLESEQ